MTLNIKDTFLSDDSLDLGSLWELVFGGAEVRDHAVMVDTTPPPVTQLIALHTDLLDSVEHAVRERFTLAHDGHIEAYARAEEMAGTPLVITRAYVAQVVRAADALTLNLYSLITSSLPPVLLASATLVVDAEDSHNLLLKVRDCERGTRLDVFVDDMVSPVLAYVDARTTRPMGLRAGFGILDPGSTQENTVADFNAYVVRSSVTKIVRPPVHLMSFGDLKYNTKYRLDRSGNSQFPSEFIGDYINFAQDEIYNELMPWKWAFRTMSFVTKAGIAQYELPPQVAMLYDVVNTSLGYQLGGVHEQDLNRVNGMRTSTGSPFMFTVVGSGDFGGLVVRLDPIPTGESVIELPYYAKPVPMEEDSEIPLIPTNFLEVLILGALKRAAISDTDATFQQQVNQSWERMVNRMKRANYTDLKVSPRITVDNQTARTRSAGITGPLLRSQQLGF